MKIGVDAGCLGIKDERLKVGVYQVTFNFFRELGKIDKKNEYLLYSFWPISSAIMAQLGPKMANVVVQPTFGWNYFALPLRLLKNKPDFFLGPSQSLPRFCPCPGLAIIYDLAFEYFPECYPESYSQLRKVTIQATRKAKKIITLSQVTKRDLIKFYQISPSKIKVAYGGYDPIFQPQPKSHKSSYFLFVGALKKTKNIPRILEAFAQFLRQNKKKDYLFIFAGGDLWLDDKIAPTIEKLGLKDKIKFLGFVPQKDLPALYRGAVAFVSPSLYEGFGLTLVEAMACGCPVICGNAGSQPEVVGSAGLQVNPKRVSEISSAMSYLVSSPALRQKLTRAGLARAKTFSWRKFSEKVLEITRNCF